jgi:hypothetical protein
VPACTDQRQNNCTNQRQRSRTDRRQHHHTYAYVSTRMMSDRVMMKVF